jgi:hypothetical protein
VRLDHVCTSGCLCAPLLKATNFVILNETRPSTRYCLARNQQHYYLEVLYEYLASYLEVAGTT